MWLGQKLADTTPHVAKFVRIKSRGIVVPWVSSVARVGNDDQFAKSEQLVVVVDGYFNVFKSEEVRCSPCRATVSRNGSDCVVLTDSVCDLCSRQPGPVPSCHAGVCFSRRGAAAERDP